MTTMLQEPLAPMRESTMPTHRVPVALMPGDGVGPEIVAAARDVLDAAGAPVAWEEIPGSGSARDIGLPRESVDAIARTGLLLKGPLATPVGAGMKSPNVTLRKLFETYANVRPARELPGVPTPFAGRGIDLVIVRENVEDVYAGIEHMQTPTVAQALKLVSRDGCERVARFACELAEDEGRRRVTCATKSNILKLTEGMMQRVFERVAGDYPSLHADHLLVDNVAHLLVREPERFDVIVTTNLQGDILSDLAAGLVGGLGVAPSANVGDDAAIFEAVHGAAPDIAGRDLANPTAILLASTMLLRHIGAADVADTIEHALFATLESGVRTRDLADGRASVGTRAFADAVIARLGERSAHWAPRRAARATSTLSRERTDATDSPATERTVGVDVFVQSDAPPTVLGPLLETVAAGTALRLHMISNRGTQIYPATGGRPSLVDHHRCRFVARVPGGAIADAELLQLLDRVGHFMRWVHVERLREFDGTPGYTRAQGER